jgi:hypothetical protein
LQSFFGKRVLKSEKKASLSRKASQIDLFTEKEMYRAIKSQPFDSKKHDLTEYAAIDLGDDGFTSFTSLFSNCNHTRFFEPVTLKLSFASASLPLLCMPLIK